MLKLDDVDLEFTDEAVLAIANKAIEQKTGARGLRSIIEETMQSVMFNIPSQKDVSKCIIDGPCITEGKEPTLVFRKKSSDNKNYGNSGADNALGVG